MLPSLRVVAAVVALGAAAGAIAAFWELLEETNGHVLPAPAAAPAAPAQR